MEKNTPKLEIEDVLIKYLTGSANTEERDIACAWIRQSSENARYYNQLNDIYISTKITQPHHNYNVDVSWNKVKARYFKKKFQKTQKELLIISTRRKYINLLKYAAIVILAFSGGIVFTNLSSTKKLSETQLVWNEVQAPLGSKTSLILADGTKVWLNAGTRLSYKADYGINSRVVYLDGEGYFQVVKNPKKPFIVQTSGLKIKAFGTSFNVKAYSEEKFVTTTLVEGIVKIEGKGINLSLKPKDVVIVDREASKHATTDNDEITGTNRNVNVPHPKSEDKESAINNNVKVASNVNTNIYTSWKDNLWIIESEPLKNIAIILERKFNVSIDIKSPELNQYTFSGTFNNETLEQILDIIKLTAPLNYQINKGIVTITEEQRRKATYNNFIK
ncbi:MAG: FecR family protein [Bacteroidota bacterium]|nr:FecR family protein [Bacteroidota bacterium]